MNVITLKVFFAFWRGLVIIMVIKERQIFFFINLQNILKMNRDQRRYDLLMC